MSLKFSKEIAFAGSLAEVSEVLASAEFRHEVARRAGSDGIDLASDELADGSVVHAIDFRQSVGDLAGPAGRVVGSEVHVKQVETWHSIDHADLRVTVPGKPGHIDGKILLEERGPETVQIVDATIKVGIPLLGGQLETLLGRILGHVLKVQREVGNELLARQSS